MAGCDLVAGIADPVQEGTEFYPLVAEDVWTGRATFPELEKGVSDNSLQILGLQWNDFEGDVEVFADGADVAQIFLPGTVARIGSLLFQPHFQVVGLQSVAALVT